MLNLHNTYENHGILKAEALALQKAFGIVDGVLIKSLILDSDGHLVRDFQDMEHWFENLENALKIEWTSALDDCRSILGNRMYWLLFYGLDPALPQFDPKRNYKDDPL